MARRARYTAEVKYFANMRKLVTEVRRSSRAQKQAINEVAVAVRALRATWRDASVAMQGVAATIQTVSALSHALGSAIDATTGASSRQATQLMRTKAALQDMGLVYDDVIQQYIAARRQVTEFTDHEMQEMIDAFITQAHGVRLTRDQVLEAVTHIQNIVAFSGDEIQTTAKDVAEVYAGQVDVLSELLPAQADYYSELMKSATLQERVEVGVRALTGAFGGTAEQIDSLTLESAQLRNTWGDLMESLGDAVRSGLVDSGVLTQVREHLDDWIAWVRDHQDEFVEFFQNAARAAQRMVNVAAAGLGTLRELAIMAGLVDEPNVASIDDLVRGFDDLRSVVAESPALQGISPDELERTLQERFTRLQTTSATAIAPGYRDEFSEYLEETRLALEQLRELRRQTAQGTALEATGLAAQLGIAENVRGTGGIGSAPLPGLGGSTPSTGGGVVTTDDDSSSSSSSRNRHRMPSIGYNVPSFQGVAIPGMHAATAEFYDHQIEQRRLLNEAMREADEERIRAEREAAERINRIRDRALEQEQERAEQERALMDVRISALGSVGRQTGETISGIIKAEKPLAIWRGAMMAAEVGWQALVLGNPIGAAQAASYAVLYGLAQAIGNALSGGGGKGGGGGGGGGYAATAQRGLIGPRESEGGETVVQNFYFGDGPTFFDDNARRFIEQQGRKAEQLRETRRRRSLL